MACMVVASKPISENSSAAACRKPASRRAERSCLGATRTELDEIEDTLILDIYKSRVSSTSSLFFFKHPLLIMSDLYLDSRKTALIAIDLQNAIMGIHTAPYPATEVVQRNRQIADQLRARGGLVVWVRVNLKQGLGLGFVVVEDACSGQDAEEHRFAFERIFPRLARVRTAEEVLNALA
jgi:hypothetical protein